MSRNPKNPTTATPATADMALARREAAELLGFDPDRLTGSDRLKCELVAALRSAVDDELMNVTSARSVDLARLITAVETLTRFLQDAKPKEDEQGAIYKRDPYKVLEDIAERWRAADEADRAEKGLSPRIHDEEALQARVDELEAELVRLRGPQPHALPALELERGVIDPPTSAITPPGEVGEFYVGGPRPSPDDPRPPVTIDADGSPLRPGSQLVNGKVVPIPPQAKSGAETKAQMERVNARRDIDHKVMNAPARVKGEPAPSTGPRIVADGGGFYWDGGIGGRGRSW